MLVDAYTEDPSCVKAAIFYSITSTQKGLQVCEIISIFLMSTTCSRSDEVHSLVKHFKNKVLNTLIGVFDIS
jgi:hypothetical protein